MMNQTVGIRCGQGQLSAQLSGSYNFTVNQINVNIAVNIYDSQNAEEARLLLASVLEAIEDDIALLRQD